MSVYILYLANVSTPVICFSTFCKLSDYVYVCVHADASPQSCLTCDWGSTLKDKVCYPRCEEGRYFSEEVWSELPVSLLL